MSLAGLLSGPFLFFYFAGVDFVESPERYLFELAYFLVGIDSCFLIRPNSSNTSMELVPVAALPFPSSFSCQHSHKVLLEGFRGQFFSHCGDGFRRVGDSFLFEIQ